MSDCHDDLTHHARAYRELRCCFDAHRAGKLPGDIFYIHSRMLERSTHLSKERGGGSLTALPIIENRGAGYIRLHPVRPDLHH